MTSVIVVFPGADPADVERLAVRPIEDAIAELDDVNDIRSTAEDGLGVIRVEFDWSSDPEKKYDEVVREVNALRASLPAEIREVILRKTNPALVNIVQYALVGESVDPRELRRVAEDLEEAIETVPGIRRADRWASPEPEVRVALDLPRMAALGIDLATAIAAVEGEGASVPGGAVEVGPRRYNIKTTGDYESLDEVADTIVASATGGRGAPARHRRRALGDRGSAVPGPLQRSPRGLRHGQHEGRREHLRRTGGAGRSASRVSSATFPRAWNWCSASNRRATCPSGCSASASISCIAIGLVSLTLLPLGLRAAGIVMVAIPLSLAMGLAGLWFARLLAQPDLDRRLRGRAGPAGRRRHRGGGEHRPPPARGRMNARRRRSPPPTRSALAVLGCTATLVFAFLPLLNLPEGAGKFTRALPLAVVLTILASLLVAFTIVPFLASRLLPRHAGPGGNAALRVASSAASTRSTQPLMHRALARPRAALAICFALFAASLLLVPRIGFSLFPPADKPQFLVTIKAPEGSALDATDRALRLVEAELARHPEVNHAMANLGKGNPLVYYNVFPLEQRSSTAEVFVELESWREDESLALLDQIARGVRRLRGRRRSWSSGSRTARPIEAPIAVRIIGRDLDVLERLAAEVEGRSPSPRPAPAT